MEKIRLEVQEKFASAGEEQRRASFQRLMEEYLQSVVRRPAPPPG